MLSQHGESWRLQILSDIPQLPDYEEGWYHGRTLIGAPVDADGQPVYYTIPAGWDQAQNDGQRWRWAVAQIAAVDPSCKNEARWLITEFARSQFGEQNMADYGWFFARSTLDDQPGDGDDGPRDESGTYALHTLGEDETIARLATGIKRFKLPEEFNYIRIFNEIPRAWVILPRESRLTLTFPLSTSPTYL